jgi:hypothetical protein
MLLFDCPTPFYGAVLYILALVLTCITAGEAWTMLSSSCIISVWTINPNHSDSELLQDIKLANFIYPRALYFLLQISRHLVTERASDFTVARETEIAVVASGRPNTSFGRIFGRIVSVSRNRIFGIGNATEYRIPTRCPVRRVPFGPPVILRTKRPREKTCFHGYVPVVV